MCSGNAKLVVGITIVGQWRGVLMHQPFCSAWPSQGKLPPKDGWRSGFCCCGQGLLKPNHLQIAQLPPWYRSERYILSGNYYNTGASIFPVLFLSCIWRIGANNNRSFGKVEWLGGYSITSGIEKSARHFWVVCPQVIATYLSAVSHMSRINKFLQLMIL